MVYFQSDCKPDLEVNSVAVLHVMVSIQDFFLECRSYLITLWLYLIPVPTTKDTGIEVAACGWGSLFEEQKRVSVSLLCNRQALLFYQELGKPKEPRIAECFTQNGGPEEFLECRDWFIQDGEGFETNSKTGCITNREPPSLSQPECRQLHKQHPETRTQLARVVTGKKKVNILNLRTLISNHTSNLAKNKRDIYQLLHIQYTQFYLKIQKLIKNWNVFSYLLVTLTLRSVLPALLLPPLPGRGWECWVVCCLCEISKGRRARILPETCGHQACE